MKILYDHQIFYRQNYGGVSRYFCELMDRFSKQPDVRFTLPLRFVQNDNLAQFPQLNKYWSRRYGSLYSNGCIDLIQKKIRFNALNYGLNFLIGNRAESIRLLKSQDFDIFHPTYYEPYFLKHLGEKPFVLTVYDMIHEKFPEYFKARDQTRAWKRNLIERADAVIAISEHTKQDILQFTHADPERIHVTYLGNPFEHTSSATPILNPPVSFKPYLLFVGVRSAYKNFDLLVTAASPLIHRNRALHIVAAGSTPFNRCERKLLQDLDLVHNVHHVAADDLLLRNLYRNASALVLPSLYEGFGFPVLEAFSCGCPAIVSNVSSLPEIAGEGAAYFEPSDPDSLAQLIERVLSDDAFRSGLITRGYDRLKFFSWEKTAESTKKVYESAIHGFS